MMSKTMEKPSQISLVVLSSIKSVLGSENAAIDLNKSFVQLGGTSLDTLSVVSTILDQGIFLSARSILESGSINDLIQHAERLQDLRDDSTSESEVCSLQRFKGESVEPNFSGLTSPDTELDIQEPPRKRMKYDPSLSCKINLSEMQTTLISGGLREPGVNIVQFYDTYATKHIPLLKAAWKSVLETENLSGFELPPDGLQTCTATRLLFSFEWTEKVFYSRFDYKTELQRPCSSSPITSIFKVLTLHERNHPDESTIVWQVHHALVDGHSAALLYKKVHRLLGGYSPSPGPCFQNIVEGVRSRQTVYAERFIEFWKRRKLQFEPAASDISLFPQPSTPIIGGHSIHTITIPLQADKLNAFSQRKGVTLACVHYAIWALVLSKFTDTSNVVFGALLTGRGIPLKGILSTVGPAINSLPFYISVDQSLSVTQLLTKIFSDMLELESVQESTPEHGFSRSFSSAIAMEPDIVMSEESRILPLEKPQFTTVSDIPISILVGQAGDASLTYQRCKYTRKSAHTIAEYYAAASRLLVNEEQSIAHIIQNMTPSNILKTLLEIGNSTSQLTSDSTVYHDLVTLFEATASSQSTKIALEKSNIKVTYKQLDQMSSIVARSLQNVTAYGDVVCVHADRSINFIVSIYAVLKAGGIYAPLDPSLPPQTRETYYKVSGAKVFIAPGTNTKLARPDICQNLICVEEVLSNTPRLGLIKPRIEPRPQDNAYICFTSGSTGKPKAVLCHHRGLVAFQLDQTVRLHAKPGVKICQIMSPAFDGSIHEIFSALSYGATLILPSAQIGFDHLQEADSAILTPSLAKVLSPSELPNLKHIYLVGEPVPQSINDLWAATKTVYNMYGPTEATCGATIKQLELGVPVTLGRPNPTSRIYILDRHQRLLPPGCIGDIYLAGVQVSRGYIGQPDITQKRFVKDSICPRPGQKMYMTGDRGYWDESGEIHYAGRNDREIKMNGFRLSLDAIEESIAQTVLHATGVALLRIQDHLVLAVQPPVLEVDEIRSRLLKTLPPYAMPREILVMDKFPMTPAGKLDYNRLESLITSTEVIVPVSSSLTETEAKIADVWHKMLKLEDDGAFNFHSNFLALGGHSLLQLSLVNQLNQVFKCSVDIKDVIQNPELGFLAKRIDTLLLHTQSEPTIPRILDELGPKCLSPIESDWCKQYHTTKDTSSFNVSVLYNLETGLVDLKRLEDGFNEVLDRHEILKSFYVSSSKDFERRQYTKPPTVRRVSTICAQDEVNKPFYLDTDYLIRVLLSDESLLICCSHIICDLTTLKILMSEVVSLYNGCHLPPVQRLYQNTTTWSNSSNDHDSIFWRQHLLPVIQQKSTFKRQVGFSGTSRTVKLDKLLASAIFDFLDACTVTPHQLALAAAALAQQFENQTIDLVIGMPYINRTQEDMKTVGLFLEQLPTRIKHSASSADEHLDSFLKSTQYCSQSALGHATSNEKIRSYLGLDPWDLNGSIFDTMVTFHDNRDTDLFPIPGVSQRIVWSEGCKFALMCEFTAINNETIIFRTEYNDKIYSTDDVVDFQGLVLAALEQFTVKATFESMRSHLRSLKNGHKSKPKVELLPFASFI